MSERKKQGRMLGKADKRSSSAVEAATPLTEKEMKCQVVRGKSVLQGADCEGCDNITACTGQREDDRAFICIRKVKISPEDLKSQPRTLFTTVRATLARSLQCTLSEVREGSSHIFHPRSVSDSTSALLGERAEQGEEEESERVWMGAGTGEKSRCRRKPDQGIKRKQGLYRNVNSVRETEPTLINTQHIPLPQVKKFVPWF
ncbi:uncharacterized protein V6R79_020389 [Siganus canaliculatus]